MTIRGDLEAIIRGELYDVERFKAGRGQFRQMAKMIFDLWRVNLALRPPATRRQPLFLSKSQVGDPNDIVSP
jgi:hypothetical protein